MLRFDARTNASGVAAQIASGDLVTITPGGDVTAAIQAAIDTGCMGVILPPGTHTISPVTGHNYCLLVQRPVHFLGQPGAILSMASTAGKQMLRIANTKGVRVEGLTFKGPGVDGTDGMQGLLQINDSDQVFVGDCAFNDADADGLAVANCTNVTIEDVTANNCSKASIYLSRCTTAAVSGLTITNGGGHTAGSDTVGAGVQISGNTDLTLSSSTITDTLGVGVLCNDNGGYHPLRNTISGVRIERAANATNSQVSCGIRLSNGATNKTTSTTVTGCTVRSSGLYSYYIENHRGSSVTANLSDASVRSAIVVGTVNGVTLSNNTTTNTNISSTAGQKSIYLLSGAQNVIGTGNSIDAGVTDQGSNNSVGTT